MSSSQTDRPVGPRRQVVLEHARAGRPTREIALLMGISTQAVNAHLKALRAQGRLNGRGAA